jgi:hypothetical protein
VSEQTALPFPPFTLTGSQCPTNPVDCDFAAEYRLRQVGRGPKTGAAAAAPHAFRQPSDCSRFSGFAGVKLFARGAQPPNGLFGDASTRLNRIGEMVQAALYLCDNGTVVSQRR